MWELLHLKLCEISLRCPKPICCGLELNCTVAIVHWIKSWYFSFLGTHFCFINFLKLQLCAGPNMHVVNTVHCRTYMKWLWSHLISTTVSITEIPASCGEYIGHQVILVMKFSGRLEKNIVPVLRIENSLFLEILRI